MTGSVTFPYTYFGNIHALETGSLHTFCFAETGVIRKSTRYFHFDFQIDERSTEADLAAELAHCFKKAVSERTHPFLGTAAVALSGGLDSRAILSSVPPGGNIAAFTLYDKLNPEVRAAQRIAGCCGVPLKLHQRDLEYYGRSFEVGVRVSGGVGSMASNHFLGVREEVRSSGIKNILTGCYCDYLFKGLAYNSAEHGPLRSQHLTRFQFDFYRPHFEISERYSRMVEERLEIRFPEFQKPRLTEADWLRVEQKRTFPLAYEGDLAQRTIPQRVLPWYPPLVDRNLLSMYLKIPPRYKLNASIFRKMLTYLCPEEMMAIPDSNNGAPVQAGPVRLLAHRVVPAALNRIPSKAVPQLATRGSWQNRDYYVQNSQSIRTLWNRNHDHTGEILSEILGANLYRRDLKDYRGPRSQFLLRLLTIKLWLAQGGTLAHSFRDAEARSLV
jgi:asparagine synthase (glutamine-hydrolysing)